MPCDSSYLEPTAREREVQRAAQLLLYIEQAVPSAQMPPWVHAIADDAHFYLHGSHEDHDRLIAYLCDWVKQLHAFGHAERVMYDGHNPQARDLADWWEKHQAADRAREQREAAEARRACLIAEAKAKLTPEELEALGL